MCVCVCVCIALEVCVRVEGGNVCVGSMPLCGARLEQRRGSWGVQLGGSGPALTTPALPVSSSATLNPKPQTLNPKPTSPASSSATLNPKPQTHFPSLLVSHSLSLARQLSLRIETPSHRHILHPTSAALVLALILSQQLQHRLLPQKQIQSAQDLNEGRIRHRSVLAEVGNTSVSTSLS